MNPLANARSTEITKVLSFGLTFVSIILIAWGLTVLPGRISNYGLLLNESYFTLAGFGLCMVALALQSISKHPSLMVMAGQFLVIEFLLWVQPVMILAGLPFPATGVNFLFYSSAASIAQTGHLAPSVYVYQAWPLQYIFLAVLRSIFPGVS